MDKAMLYDIMYALAAKDGRDEVLFGDCAPAAREAFCRSLVGDAFPELWFELPLAGEPWFDLHSLTAYVDVAGTQQAYAGQGGVYADALAWFAGQQPHAVRQLALSYDSSSGDVDHPAVQVLVDRYDPAVHLGFLQAVGRSDMKDPFKAFLRNMPEEWYPCYVGAFPGRDGAEADRWVRVECIVGDSLQQAYATDADTLRGHLACIGLVDADDVAIKAVQELARTPFPLELQFNVGPQGDALPVVSASVRFQPDELTSRLGDIARLYRRLQEWGVVDDRWQLLADATFAKRVSHGDESIMLFCFPAFVKLRWRAGMPLDAKTYLMARFE